MTTIAHQLQVLFATFPPPAGDVTAQLEAYSITLNGHDLRDIEAAVRRFIRGEVEGHNQNFAPTAAKLGGVVRQCMDARLDAEYREKLSRPALPPPDIERSPEDRAKVKARLAAYLNRTVSALRTDEAEAEARRKAVLDKANERFAPSMDEADMKRRLGFTVGDPDAEADAA